MKRRLCEVALKSVAEVRSERVQQAKLATCEVNTRPGKDTGQGSFADPPTLQVHAEEFEPESLHTGNDHPRGKNLKTPTVTAAVASPSRAAKINAALAQQVTDDTTLPPSGRTRQEIDRREREARRRL